MVEETVNNLLKKEYLVKVYKTKEEAVEYLKENVKNKIIGFGGSVTLEEMNLYDELKINNEIHWHHRKENNLSTDEIRLLANNSQIYFSSVNGLTKDGEIINIDNMCNRVSAIFYGHEKVYLIVGINKIEDTYDKALYRARNIAAPKNAKRLGIKTPCAVNADKCYNCKSSDRICRGLSVLWEKPKGNTIEIIIIEENLGY